MQALQQLKEEKVGKQMLVPVTSSMYVKGKLDCNENVVVDIGTGTHTMWRRQLRYD